MKGVGWRRSLCLLETSARLGAVPGNRPAPALLCHGCFSRALLRGVLGEAETAGGRARRGHCLGIRTRLNQGFAMGVWRRRDVEGSLPANRRGKMGSRCGVLSMQTRAAQNLGRGFLLGAPSSLCTSSLCPRASSCPTAVGGEGMAAEIIRNPSEITLSVMCLQLLASLGLVWQEWGRNSRSKRSVTAADEKKIPEWSSAGGSWANCCILHFQAVSQRSSSFCHAVLELLALESHSGSGAPMEILSLSGAAGAVFARSSGHKVRGLSSPAPHTVGLWQPASWQHPLAPRAWAPPSLSFANSGGEGKEALESWQKKRGCEHLCLLIPELGGS